MRRYGGLDDKGLVASGLWKDIASASRYSHAKKAGERTSYPRQWRNSGNNLMTGLRL